MEIKVEHLCWLCRNYTFKVRPAGDTEYGLAFCELHQKWFKDQQKGKPAGTRTCPKWEG